MIIIFLKAILLGIVEGLTEFLPISSTAHLLVISRWIGFNTIKNGMFEVVIQVGAVLAVCWFYRKRLLHVVMNLGAESSQRLSINLFLALIPSIVIGLTFHSKIKLAFGSDFVIAMALIIGGVIMLIVDNKKIQRISEVDNIDRITPGKAFLIGIFQSFAVVPGVSRAATTIIGGMTLGLNRVAATEFSFFLAIPTILAAASYDVFKSRADFNLENVELLLIGVLVSFLSALIVIKWFLAYVSKHSFRPFAIYRILVGFILL